MTIQKILLEWVKFIHHLAVGSEQSDPTAFYMPSEVKNMKCQECGKILTDEDCYGHDCEVF